MLHPDVFARTLRTVARELGRVARDRSRAGGITPQRIQTLQLIAEHRVLSTSRLAALLGIDSSTATRNLAKLEQQRLIVCRRAADDTRQNDIRLSARGQRAVRPTEDVVHAAYATVLEKLPVGERERVHDALLALVGVLERTA